MRKQLSDKGFSLIELIVTVLIMAIIAAGTGVSVRVVRDADAERAARKLCSMMQLARSKAMALSEEDGSAQQNIVLTIEARSDGYYAVIKNSRTDGTLIENLKEEKLGNNMLSIAISNFGNSGTTYSSYALPDDYQDAYDASVAAGTSDTLYADLMRITAGAGVANARAMASYTFYKGNGAIKYAGTSATGYTHGGTRTSQYYDIYVEGSTIEHIVIVKETGRCYLYENE